MGKLSEGPAAPPQTGALKLGRVLVTREVVERMLTQYGHGGYRIVGGGMKTTNQMELVVAGSHPVMVPEGPGVVPPVIGRIS